MKRFLTFLLPLFFCSLSNAQPQTSPVPTKQLWQTKLNVEETDFIQFVSKDRVLVGTGHVHPIIGGALSRHEIMLLNLVTGETVWAVSREHDAFPQTLLAVSPVIALQGSTQFVALNPVNGAQIFSKELAREESVVLPSQNLIVFVDRKPPPMSLAATDIPDR